MLTTADPIGIEDGVNGLGLVALPLLAGETELFCHLLLGSFNTVMISIMLAGVSVCPCQVPFMSFIDSSNKAKSISNNINSRGS